MNNLADFEKAYTENLRELTALLNNLPPLRAPGEIIDNAITRLGRQQDLLRMAQKIREARTTFDSMIDDIVSPILPVEETKESMTEEEYKKAMEAEKLAKNAIVDTVAEQDEAAGQDIPDDEVFKLGE